VPGRDISYIPRDAKRMRFTKRDKTAPEPFLSKNQDNREMERDYRYNRKPRNWVTERRKELWRMILMIVVGVAILGIFIYLDLAK